MKNLTILLALSTLFLFGCDDSKAPLDGSATTDARATGHYEASFFVVEGDCHDIEAVQFVIFEGDIQEPHEEYSYFIEGTVFMDGAMSGTAEGSAFYLVSFDGDLGNDEFSGGWTTEGCRGFFTGGKTSDLSDHEYHLYDAL